MGYGFCRGRSWGIEWSGDDEFRVSGFEFQELFIPTCCEGFGEFGEGVDAGDLDGGGVTDGEN